MNLLHGDCLELMKSIPDNSVDLVLADPPYGMNFVSNYRKEKYNKIQNDDSFFLSDELLKNIYRITKNNSHLYVFCSFHLIGEFKHALGKFFTVKNVIIWEKNNTSMGDLSGDYAPKYEMIIYCHKGRRTLNGGRDPNIIKYKRTGNKNHPTEKPVDLLEFLISKSSNEGETVLDFTMGSGSTGVAAKNLNRKFIGIEQDDKYFEIAKNRINA